jgi:uncharacterized cofD-like protein
VPEANPAGVTGLPPGSPSARIVALGGGHGLAASLAALRRITDQLTAVVTVADDGGSSGRLRRELGVLPPGDLRMALAALCGDDEWGRTWSEVIQHRFSHAGELHGHAVGNLLIVALWERLGDPVSGLDWVGRLLGARGRVLPMASVPLDIEATVEVRPSVSGAETETNPAIFSGVGEAVVRGQEAVARSPWPVKAIRLIPEAPPACTEALEAIETADWVFLGPGSWFTSVLPHLLVPELRKAIVETEGRRAVVLNLAPQLGETSGFSPATHLEVLRSHAPELRIDAVVADEQAATDISGLEAAAARLGAEVRLAPVALGDGTPRHDPALLARAYAALVSGTI